MKRSSELDEWAAENSVVGGSCGVGEAVRGVDDVA